MNEAEYNIASEKTERKFNDGLELTQFQAEFLHAAMGMVTEVAEVVDALKKHLIYGKELDLVNIKEEMGDLQWYEAMVRRLTGLSDEEIRITNINKLAARYPGKFTEEAALNRDTNKERKILEE
jgi:NTP pyrophosphatase (non-canonical NTP hydrolase)